MPSATANALDALLPQTQCTRCGYPACRPYAEAIAAGEAPINRCPPGGAATNKLVNRQVIEALGPEGTLTNVARGTVVDEKEMVDALVEGRLGAAGLDVFENEPNVPEALFPLENVVLLPHVGSGTVETRRAMGDLTVENLVRFFDEGTVTTPVPECAHLVAKG